MAKSDYMLAIIWLLRSRGQMTAQELAETLELSVRSIYRYIDSLCASGVPIVAESGHEGGYRLPSNYQSVPLFFSAEEKIALAHSALFAQKAGYPFTSALTEALRKVQYGSTTKQVEDLSLHTVSVDVLAVVDHSAYADLLADLERTIAYGQTVQMAYRKAKDEETVVREVNPYGLIHWRDRWYVVGHCHLRQELRSFRVDRVRDYTLTSATFTRPEGFSAGAFFANQQIASNTDGDGLTEVVLAGDTDAMDDLANHWFMGPRAVRNESEGVQSESPSHLPNQSPAQSECQSSSESRSQSSLSSQATLTLLVEQSTLHSYVPHILLAYGRSVRIIQPDSLRQRMRTLLTELVAHYES